MKYLKTFESFNESFDTKNVNEGADVLDTAQTAVKAGIDKLDDTKKTEVTGELTKLAEKLKLSMEDMGDPKKVALALAKANAVKESEDTEDADYDALDEGKRWDALKGKVGKFLTWAGLGTTVGGLISLAVSAEQTAVMTNYLDYVPDGMQGIAPLAAIGMVAMAIGISALVTGLNLAPEMKN